MSVRRVLARLRYVLRHRRHDDELREELEWHRLRAQEQLEASGLTAADADVRSRRIFGNEASVRNQVRDIWIWPALQDMTQDVRFAVRMLAKDRRFTAAAIVALALGIAVNNSVFAIVNADLIKDVPFDEPARLMAIRSVDIRGRDAGVSFAAFQDVLAKQGSFEGIAASTGAVMNVSGEALAPERFRGAFVSASTFALLRTTATLGRTFVASDDVPGAPPVVILGHGVWQRRYGGDPSVLGRTVKVNDIPAVIVGVMPEGFSFPAIAEIWQPLAIAPGLTDAPRDARTLTLLARLTRASSLVEARANLESIAGRLAIAYPATDQPRRLSPRERRR